MRGAVPRLAAALALAALCSCVGDSGAGGEPQPATDPAYLHRERANEYAGDGREDLEPADLEGVPLGWFGPADPAHPLAGGMWSAARLAIEEANARGGYDGEAYRLIPAWSENPWGTGVAEVTRLVYEEDIRALVGAPDGPSAHLVEQITAKARLPFVNPVSTDKSANLAGVPWIFSVAPGDHLIAPVLAEALTARAGGFSMALVSATDHDSRLLARELLVALEARGVGPALHLEFRPEGASFARLLEALRHAEHAVLALIAGPVESGSFLVGYRAAGLDATVVGGPSMGRRLFRETAGATAEGVLFPLLWDRESVGAPAASFAARFEARTGLPPDYAEAFAYDATTLLLAAIEEAGLNRVRIGDAVRAIAPWNGAGGPIRWDRTGQNTRPVPLGTWDTVSHTFHNFRGTVVPHTRFPPRCATP